MLSNVPPFIKNEMLKSVVECHGKLTAQIPLGLKILVIKHVMSFCRFTCMILNTQHKPLNLSVKLMVEGKDDNFYQFRSNEMLCVW